MKENKDRRVINIPKTDYDLLKAYCDENTLDMPKWMVKNSKERIPDVSFEDGLLGLLSERPYVKFKTYENVDPEFRFTKEFIINVLVPKSSPDFWKIVKDKRFKRFIIKQEILNVPSSESKFCYLSVDEETPIRIKNAYKDLCDDIEWGVQENIEDGKMWWVYILNTKDTSYYE